MSEGSPSCFGDQNIKAKSDKSHYLISTEAFFVANINWNSKVEKLLEVKIDYQLNFDTKILLTLWQSEPQYFDQYSFFYEFRQGTKNNAKF